MKNVTRIALAWELFEQEVPKLHIARDLNIGRATIYRWLNGIQKKGDLEAFNEQAFIEAFNRSLRKEYLGWVKYQPKEIPTLTKEVENWLDYYHTRRPHLSLAMRPPLGN